VIKVMIEVLGTCARSTEMPSAWATVHECTLSRVSEEAALAASSALAMVDTAE
jgi:hypothetical protein